MKPLSLYAPALLLTISLAAQSPSAPTTVDSDTFSGLNARNIGPAVTGGRIAAIDATEVNGKLTIYVGSAGGGVWKSDDGGTTFKPKFDKYNQSIGAVAIDPTDSKTVWVGTGEPWTRNSVSVGDGLYVTHDGGDTWKNVGLKDSEHISRILIDPKDAKTVYVCALGHLWNDNEERGLYKTSDAGSTWKKIISVDTKTGCADVAMDPSDSKTLYASTWQFRRTGFSFSSGGPGSALLKSTDGGEHWKPIRTGLPAGDFGRIGIAVSKPNPKRVFAVVEAKHSALFRSDDGGEHWTEMNDSFNIIGRPFYFARITTDPNIADRIYKTGFNLTVSDDGGKSFAGAALGGGDKVHGDYHGIWIDPKNSNNLLTIDDGGLYASYDRGAHWRFFNNLPIPQFYHVALDMQTPYYVYGGLQDNGSWMGPSAAVGGIENRHWHNIGFGDGFHAFADPTDSEYAYSEWQGGRLQRVRRTTLEAVDIQPLAGAKDPEYRFNWNTPVALSPSKPGVMYIGCQYLFRSADHGTSWQRISPDLTTNDPAKQKQAESGGLTVDNSDAEKYETIYTIAESPKAAGVIWVGTDDGNVQLTRDGGKTWTNLSKNISGLPANTWVSTIEAGHHDPAVAYASFDGHTTGDMKTYLYKTSDYGKTWQPLASSGISGYAHVIREDLKNPNLLFAGTENGFFVSLDGGANWAIFQNDLPPVAVRDIAIHPRDHDVVLATHGRGMWIIDDITPLRALTPEVLAKDAALLPTRPAQVVPPSSEQRSDGDAEFMGNNAPEAATIAYYLKKRHMFGPLKAEVFDAQGNLITTLPASKRRGINRIEWAMRLKSPRTPPAASLVQSQFAFMGPTQPEGTYTVKLTRGTEVLTSTIQIVPDPRSKATAAERTAQHQLAMRLYNDLEELSYVSNALVSLRDQAKAKGKQPLADSAEAQRVALLAVKEGGMITGERKLREYLGELYGSVNGMEGRPSQSQSERAAVLEAQLKDARSKMETLASSAKPDFTVTSFEEWKKTAQ